MKKEDLLEYCRYYNGEDKMQPSDADKYIIWRAERAWVNDFGNDENTDKVLNEYIAYGLTYFAMTDHTPIHLKAFIFQSFCHFEERVNIEEFKKFYTKYYSKTST